MNTDSIVEEIHRIREKMLEECGGDINKLMDRMKARKSSENQRKVSPGEPKEKKFSG